MKMFIFIIYNQILKRYLKTTTTKKKKKQAYECI